jgi:hypothetical protein
MSLSPKRRVKKGEIRKAYLLDAPQLVFLHKDLPWRDIVERLVVLFDWPKLHLVLTLAQLSARTDRL